ncbi:MAG TPA: metallophosphoesterase [Phycisphaerae bacterium]|nr:metallophosphoesterase [Phycisphaerae bacterium]HNU44213.1 metallophosphoesterase [Phycisphaerae bacterium]
MTITDTGTIVFAPSEVDDVRHGTLVVRTRSVAVPHLPEALVGLRILHLSDLHVRGWTDVLTHTQRLLAETPVDFVAVTGDLAPRTRRWRKVAHLICRVFEPVAGRVPVFAVPGNHDGRAMATHPNLPFRLLLDEWEPLRVRGQTLAVAGLAQWSRRDGNPQLALPHPALSLPTILLTHYPSAVYRIRPGSVLLLLSGHTHGGQIRFTKLGCLFNHDRIPLRASQGLHRLNGTLVHVTAGVGLSGPVRIRINCPPELVALTLTRTPEDVQGAPQSIPPDAAHALAEVR